MRADASSEIDAIERTLANEARSGRQHVMQRALARLCRKSSASTRQIVQRFGLMCLSLFVALLAFQVPIGNAIAMSIGLAFPLVGLAGGIVYIPPFDPPTSVTAALHDGLCRIRYLVDTERESISRRERERLAHLLVTMSDPAKVGFHARAAHQLVGILRSAAGPECLPALDQVASGTGRVPGLLTLRRNARAAAEEIRKRIERERSRASLLRPTAGLDNNELLRPASGHSAGETEERQLLRPVGQSEPQENDTL